MANLHWLLLTNLRPLRNQRILRSLVILVWVGGLVLTPRLAWAEATLLPSSGQVSAYLTDQDIPPGQSGLYRDYRIQLKADDQIVIDLTSEEFDTIVTLLGPNGNTIAENDDSANGSTNSLLFTRISRSGEYTIRVRAFGETAGGKFFLKLTRLRPVY